MFSVNVDWLIFRAIGAASVRVFIERVDNMRQETLRLLDNQQIAYVLVEHPAVYTIEEMEQLELANLDQVVKNIFVRDDKKKRFFLVSVVKDKRVNLKELRTKLDSRPLSFASETSLHELLKLDKGAVTPLGILNDKACKVEVVLDSELQTFDKVGIHPNDNTATVWLSPSGLEQLVLNHGNKFTYVEI